jgi:adenine phosphoribosyltransferase
MGAHPEQPSWSSEAIIDAIRRLVSDFDDRATNTVTGTRGRTFSFFPTAVTDNIPPLTYELSEAVCLLAQLHIEHAGIATLGVGEEDRGAMITGDILRQYRLPRTLARWNPSGVPGEVAVEIANEYLAEGTTLLYLNGVRPGDRVLLVDDLTSTGGTLVALARAVAVAGGEVIEVLTIGEKTENGGRAFVAEALGLSIKTIVETDLVDRGTGPRSRVRRINLGRLNRHCFESVARHFPPGFCQLGSGADVMYSTFAQPA